MTKIQEGLAAIVAARYTSDQFRRQFSDMLLSGLVSKGYTSGAGAFLTITDAGRKALADVG